LETFMPRSLLLLLITCLALSACGQPTAQQPAASAVVAPTEPATPGVPPTPTLDLPTPPPQITSAPAPAEAPIPAGWWDEAVCYEIFVRSFYDSDGDGIGDFNGLIEKLDYINDGDPNTVNDLGVNCIWLMPISDATSYHGYDVIDYFSVHPEYGTNDDFKRLVEEANARGIKVIIDLVLNHTSVEHPWFQEALRDPNSPYRDFYLWSNDKPPYRGPFGNNEVWHKSPVADEYYYGLFWSGMPDLNYRNPAVTAEAQRISLFWIEEMGVDGFRLDAIKHMIEYQAMQADTPETFEWLRAYRQFLDARAPGTFTIGEIYDAGPRQLQNYFPDQLYYYFEFEVAAAIRTASNIGLARTFLDAVEAAYTQLPDQRWSPFLTNHDQNRVMSGFRDDMSKGRIAAFALLTIPGLPFLYYGEEIGMVGVKPDEDIRTPMQWTKEEFGGFTAGIPWRNPQGDYPVKNVLMQEEDPDSLLNTYRRLIHLRLTTPALASGDFIPLATDSSSVSAFLRKTADQTVLVLINFDGATLPNVAVDGAGAGLTPGTYTVTTLYGDAAPPEVVVGADGAFSNFTPLAEIPGRTGYVFKLTPP
jgi:alpha-amylase